MWFLLACVPPVPKVGDCELWPADQPWSYEASGHQGYVEGVVEDITAAGSCGEPPTRGMTLGGCTYDLAESLVVLGDWVRVGVRRYPASDEIGAEIASISLPRDRQCEWSDEVLSEFDHPSQELIGGSLAASTNISSTKNALLFVAGSADPANNGYSYEYAWSGWDAEGPTNDVTATENDDGTYSWSCIDDVEPPEDLTGGPAWYSGYAYLHTERWLLESGEYVLGGQYEGLPLDILVPLGDVFCGYAENASREALKPYHEVYYPECDGLDNDLDGEVDEGAHDLNRNGVPDCQEEGEEG